MYIYIQHVSEHREKTLLFTSSNTSYFKLYNV